MARHVAVEIKRDVLVRGHVTEAASLLRGLEPGRRVRFTIDADEEAIVKITSSDE